jgi:hypothetical protein
MTTSEHFSYVQGTTASGLTVSAQTVDPVQNRVNTIRHLLATMMLGRMYRQSDDAEIIRKAVEPTMGNGKELRISLAFAAAAGGDASIANSLLAEGVDDWENAEMVKMTLAMSLMIAGDPNWRILPEQVLAVSSNPAVRNVAENMIKQGTGTT